MLQKTKSVCAAGETFGIWYVCDVYTMTDFKRRPNSQKTDQKQTIFPLKRQKQTFKTTRQTLSTNIVVQSL